MQREQLQSNLDFEMHAWLIDQKPKNLSEVARLADQYLAVREADRTAFKGHESTSKGHTTKSFGESGGSNASVGFQKTSFSHNIKAHDDQKSSATSSSAKFDRFAAKKVQGLCFHCRKPGHRISIVPSDGQEKNRTMFQCN